MTPDLPVEAVFLLQPEEMDQLMAVIDAELPSLFNVNSAVECGFTAG